MVQMSSCASFVSSYHLSAEPVSPHQGHAAYWCTWYPTRNSHSSAMPAAVMMHPKLLCQPDTPTDTPYSKGTGHSPHLRSTAARSLAVRLLQAGKAELAAAIAAEVSEAPHSEIFAIVSSVDGSLTCIATSLW